MTAPAPRSGYLVTFTPCGHTAHYPAAPAAGSWLTHWGKFTGPRPGCQSPREVAAVRPCPGCPDCWRQPSLFGELREAA